MRVHNGDTAIITFTGVGYDKRIMGETMPMTDQQDLTGVPRVQSVAVPGQVSAIDTAASEKVPSDISAQRRFRSACAFVQSDQNLPWVHFEY